MPHTEVTRARFPVITGYHLIPAAGFPAWAIALVAALSAAAAVLAAAGVVSFLRVRRQQRAGRKAAL
jgi:hypothetical protein